MQGQCTLAALPEIGWEMWAYGVLAVALVASSLSDIRDGTIRNAVTYPAILIGLIGHTVAAYTLVGNGLWPVDEVRLGLLGSLGGFAAGFVPLLAAWLAGGIGGGDAKLMGAVGALTGWRFAVAAMFYGFIIAAVMAVGVMVKRRIVKKTLRRIWHWLYLTFTPAKAADPATQESPKIPFGLALCIGSAIALADVLIRTPVAERLWIGI